MTGKPWFRMYAEFVSDPKVQLLAFEDQRHFIAILCLKCNGTLDSAASSDDYRERMIAKALGLDIASAKEARRRLVEVGIVRDDWQPTKWDARQYESDLSTDRVRRFRERNAAKRSETVSETDKSRTEQSRTEQNSPSRSSQSQTPSSYSPQAIQEPLKRLSGRLRGGVGG